MHGEGAGVDTVTAFGQAVRHEPVEQPDDAGRADPEDDGELRDGEARFADERGQRGGGGAGTPRRPMHGLVDPVREPESDGADEVDEPIIHDRRRYTSLIDSLNCFRYREVQTSDSSSASAAPRRG